MLCLSVCMQVSVMLCDVFVCLSVCLSVCLCICVTNINLRSINMEPHISIVVVVVSCLRNGVEEL